MASGVIGTCSEEAFAQGQRVQKMRGCHCTQSCRHKHGGVLGQSAQPLGE